VEWGKGHQLQEFMGNSIRFWLQKLIIPSRHQRHGIKADRLPTVNTSNPLEGRLNPLNRSALYCSR